MDDNEYFDATDDFIIVCSAASRVVNTFSIDFPAIVKVKPTI